MHVACLVMPTSTFRFMTSRMSHNKGTFPSHCVMRSKPDIPSICKLARPDFDCSLASLPLPTRIITLMTADLDVDHSVLIDFVRFARHVIDQDNPLKTATFAGRLYLALIRAFEAEAIIEYKWATAYNLEMQSIEYGVFAVSYPCGSDSTELFLGR